MPMPHPTATDRLHAHIRARLAGHSAETIAAAIAAADAEFNDGAGHMQTALDIAIRHATNTTTRNAA